MNLQNLPLNATALSSPPSLRLHQLLARADVNPNTLREFPRRIGAMRAEQGRNEHRHSRYGHVRRHSDRMECTDSERLHLRSKSER